MRYESKSTPNEQQLSFFFPKVVHFCDSQTRWTKRLFVILFFKLLLCLNLSIGVEWREGVVETTNERLVAIFDKLQCEASFLCCER